MICGHCQKFRTRRVGELRTHLRTGCKVQTGWAHVAELRRTGQDETAGRVARKLLGAQGEPMTDEQKEERRRYNEEHKEDRKQKAKAKRELRRRTIALLTTGRRK